MKTAGVIALLFFFTFILIKSADLTLESLKSLARKLNIHSFTISAVILAIATSLPELFVGITSAIEGSPQLSLGNVLGANIANLSLVVGLSTLVAGSVVIREKVIFKEILLAGGAAVLPIALMYDGVLGRIDGAILLAIYLAYATSFFKIRFQQIGTTLFNGRFFLRFVRHVEDVEQKVDRTLGHLFVGIAALLFSADFIVRLSKEMAVLTGIPIFVIGIIILSIGTTLPELVVSIQSLKGKETGVFMGNVLGSLIVNSTLVLGMVALISPFGGVGVESYLSALVVFVIVFSSFWIFTKTKLRLDRWEAVALLLVYIIFAVSEFI